MVTEEREKIDEEKGWEWRNKKRESRGEENACEVVNGERRQERGRRNGKGACR